MKRFVKILKILIISLVALISISLLLNLFAVISLSLMDKPEYNVCLEGSGSEVGDIIRLYKSDTTVIFPNTNREYEGSYFNFHHDSVIETKFIRNIEYFYTLIDIHISDHIINDTFLLADQKPIDSILGKMEPDGYGGYQRPREPNIYSEKLKMLKESPIHQFWIINHVSKDVYGPFSYEEYLLKKKELKVNPELKLKYENNCQP